MENLRIYFCTDLYTLAMTQVMNVIEPYKIINVSVKQHGVFEKHNWETDMPYIKYQELLCEMIDRIELADKEYYED